MDMNHKNPNLELLCMFNGVCQANVSFVEIIEIKCSFPIDDIIVPFENQKWMFQLHEGSRNCKIWIIVDIRQWL